MNWSNRKVKVFERRSFFQGIGRKYAYLTLPGSECLDIITGIQEKVINTQTKILAVERDAQEFSSICDWFAHNWPKDKSQLVNAELSTVIDLDPLDLVFLDYLGNITQSDAYWIKYYLAPALMHNAHLGITVSTAFRNNKLYPAVKNYVQKHHPTYLQKKIRYIRDHGRYPKKLLEFFAVYYTLIHCYLFPDHSCTVSIEYYGEPHSSNLMVLFKLLNMQIGHRDLDEDESAIHDAIDEIVQPSIRGLCMSKTLVPVSPKENPMKAVSSKKVIDALLSAKTTGQKAAATRALNVYADQRAKAGFNPVMVKAGIKASISRLQNLA